MTPELLEHFVFVAKYQNISRAAEALFMDNSSLGRQMSKLEDYYGTQLLIRNNRSVELTPAGQELFRSAPTLLKNISEVRNRVRAAGMQGGRYLSVATLNIVYQPLYDLYHLYKEKNTDISLHIRNVSPGEVLEYVLCDNADIGVESSTKINEYRDQFETLVLDTMHYCLLVNTGHRLADRESVRLTELAGERFVVMDTKLPEQFLRTFKEHGDVLNQLVTSPYTAVSWQDMILQVRVGTGIALLPSMIAKSYPADCKTIEIEDELDEAAHLMLFWKPENKNPELASFVELAKQEFAWQNE